jgi:hypothetical protein
MDSQIPDTSERRPRPVRNLLIVAILAFLVGLALMAWALTRWEPAKRLVQNDPAPVRDMPIGAPMLPVTNEAAALAPASQAPVAAPAPGVDEGQIAALETRMARIDLRAADAAANASRAEGLLIAFAARRAVDRGVPLGYLEGQLRDRFGTAQPRAIATIIGASQTPVTLDGLKGMLDALRPQLSGADADEGWWQATQRTISNLVIVRRQQSGSPAPDQRLDRGMLRLQAGEVESAMVEIARLPGRAAAEQWLEQARRYVEAHRALDVIEAAALTEGESPTGPPAAGQRLAPAPAPASGPAQRPAPAQKPVVGPASAPVF